MVHSNVTSVYPPLDISSAAHSVVSVRNDRSEQYAQKGPVGDLIKHVQAR
jgi:hypothetical protein